MQNISSKRKRNHLDDERMIGRWQCIAQFFLGIKQIHSDGLLIAFSLPSCLRTHTKTHQIFLLANSVESQLVWADHQQWRIFLSNSIWCTSRYLLDYCIYEIDIYKKLSIHKMFSFKIDETNKQRKFSWKENWTREIAY